MTDKKSTPKLSEIPDTDGKTAVPKFTVKVPKMSGHFTIVKAHADVRLNSQPGEAAAS